MRRTFATVQGYGKPGTVDATFNSKPVTSANSTVSIARDAYLEPSVAQGIDAQSISRFMAHSDAHQDL